MAKYVINGGKRLHGEIDISGAKNAAVAILPAALLVNGTCRIENVPDISDVKNLTIAPRNIKGYVNNDYYYKDGKKQYKAIIADGILSEVIEHKKNVYRVKNHGETEITYLVQDGDVYSHGKTLKEAKESLIYKLSNRDTSQYKDYTLDTKVTKKEAIQMYRAITGACEQGTRMFVEGLSTVPRNLTVKKIIELTEGRYGNDKFRKFFEVENEYI